MPGHENTSMRISITSLKCHHALPVKILIQLIVVLGNSSYIIIALTKTIAPPTRKDAGTCQTINMANNSMAGDLMNRIIHAEPFSAEVLSLLSTSAMTKDEFERSQYSADYSLDQTITFINGARNRDTVFEIFGRFSSDHATKVRQIMINAVSNNIDDFKTHCRMALVLKGLSAEQWLAKMKSSDYVGDELCLFALGKVYFRHSSILNKYNVWSTIASTVRTNTQLLNNAQLLKRSCVRLLFMGQNTFGILKPKTRLVMQSVLRPNQPGRASTLIQLPENVGRQFQRGVRPIIQNRRQIGNTYRAINPTAQSHHSVSTSSATGSYVRPWMAQQVRSRSRGTVFPVAQTTTNRLRPGMNGSTTNQYTQIVRPTAHMLTRHPGGNTYTRATLQNPNPGLWLPSCSAPHRRSTLATSTMSHEVAEVLENLERRHPTRNSRTNLSTTVEVPTITLSDSESEPANGEVSTVPTVPTDSPTLYQASSPIKNTGYDKEPVAKSVNLSQPDEHDSGDDSTCELLRELDFDEDEDSIFVQKKTNEETVAVSPTDNTKQDEAILSSVDPSVGNNVLCEQPNTAENSTNRANRTTTEDGTLINPKPDALPSSEECANFAEAKLIVNEKDNSLNTDLPSALKLDEQTTSTTTTCELKRKIKIDIESIGIKVEKEIKNEKSKTGISVLECAVKTEGAVKTEQDVKPTIKIENAKELEKFVDVPKLDPAIHSDQLVEQDDDTTSNSEENASFMVLDEGLIRSLMNSEAAKRKQKQTTRKRKRTADNKGTGKRAKSKSKRTCKTTNKCTPIDRTINALFSQLKEIKTEIKRENVQSASTRPNLDRSGPATRTKKRTKKRKKAKTTAPLSPVLTDEKLQTPEISSNEDNNNVKSNSNTEAVCTPVKVTLERLEIPDIYFPSSTDQSKQPTRETDYSVKDSSISDATVSNEDTEQPNLTITTELSSTNQSMLENVDDTTGNVKAANGENEQLSLTNTTDLSSTNQTTVENIDHSAVNMHTKDIDSRVVTGNTTETVDSTDSSSHESATSDSSSSVLGNTMETVDSTDSSSHESATSESGSSDEQCVPVKRRKRKKIRSSTSDESTGPVATSSDVHDASGGNNTAKSNSTGKQQATQRKKRRRITSSNRTSTYKRKFTCIQCKVVKYSLQELNHHFRSTHQPLICQDCNKSFATPSGLHKHSYVHQATPFKCDKCEKSYPFQSQLSSHLLTHTNVLEYHCNHDGCGKDFKRKNEYEKHSEVHKGIVHKCHHANCGYQNFDVRNLMAHLKVHTPEVKTYTCKYCKETFLHYNQRTRHIEDNKCSVLNAKT